MEDPLFPVTIKVGGTGLSYRFAAFPPEMHSNQSFILEPTLINADLSAYDLSAATSTLYVSGWKNGFPETILIGGVIVANKITFTVPKDLIPVGLGSLPLRSPGNSVFYFRVFDADSELQFFQQVNVFDPNYTLSGDVAPSSNVIIPEANDLGTVISVGLDTPPVSPVFGDAYIIGTSPTGLWSTNANDLTVFNGVDWVFYDSLEGNFVFDSNTNQQQIFDGTEWAPTSGVLYADGNSIEDINNNELITFGVAASAVNNIKTSNAATAGAPKIEVIGGDTDIALEIDSKGAANIKMLSTVQWSKGADVASATALPLINDGNYPDVTGTTTITSFDSVGVGTVQKLHFDAALILTHNATDLVLPGGANITTAAGDEFTFVEYAAGDWRCTGYALANGKSISGITAEEAAAGVDNNQTGTTYTLVLTDADNKTVWMDNAASNVVTVPLNASVAFPTGTKIPVMQEGAGETTITGDTGVTVNGVSAGSFVISARYSGALLAKRGTNTWIITG